MSDDPKPQQSRSLVGQWLLAAVIVLGGTGYVFRHILFPTTHAPKTDAPDTHVEAPTESLMAVTVATAEARPIARRIVTGGTLVAREEVLIVAEVTGVRIVKAVVEVGDEVREGQILAVLDRQRLDLLLAQKAADLARAEAVMAESEALAVESDTAAAEAKAVLDRALALQEKGAISAQSLEERTALAATAAARSDAQSHALLAARAELLRVVAERDELAWQVSQLDVRATVSGVITERNAQVGQTSAGDGTPMFRITKDGLVEMEALVIETALPDIRVGQAVTVTVAGSSLPVEGEVRLVSPSIDPMTRMSKVWIRLDGTNLKPGGFAAAAFETAQRNAIVVPHTAVLAGDAGSRVQVVKDGVVTLRAVETGLITPAGIEIISGLVPGERVVALAGGFLREGTRIEPVAAATRTAAGEF